MNIGEPQREIIAEPLELPEPLRRETPEPQEERPTIEPIKNPVAV